MIPTPPYPRSKRITGIRWCSEAIRYPGSHGDTWSCTWADDGHVYTTADDCTGIDKSNNSNLALFRVAGAPPRGHRISLVNPMDAYGSWGEYDRADSWKAAGLASIDGVLYMGVGQHSSAYAYGDRVQRTYDGSIIKSTDHGRTWSCKKRDPMFPTPRFSTPFFVQYGQDYAGARDNFVYITSGTTWNNGNHLALARVPRDRIARLDSADYEVFIGLDPTGEPRWTPYRHDTSANETAIFVFRGFTSMTGMHWVPAAQRFLLPQWAYSDLDAPDPWRQTFLHLYEAPNPWGPWSLVHVEDDFGVAWYNPSLPSAWFEDGGKRMWMVSGGDFNNSRVPAHGEYTFQARQMELMLT